MREDMVRVKLTKAGETLGGVGLRGEGYEFMLTPGKTLEVSIGDWTERLSRVRQDGAELVELVRVDKTPMGKRPVEVDPGVAS